MASASLDTVMAPSSTCATNSFTRFLPRSLAAGSRARRPSSTIWSSNPRSTVCSAADAGASGLAWLLIAALLHAHLRPQFGQLVLVGNGLAQQFLELVVALHVAAQVAQAVAQFQQFAQRSHLAGDVLGREIVHALEIQIDLEVSGVRILTQFVLDGVSQVRLHVRQNAVEVVRVDLHEFPVLQPRLRLGRLAGEIAHHPHDERQFLDFNRVADFYVVSNLDARRSDAIDLMLCALSCHNTPSSKWRRFTAWYANGRYSLYQKKTPGAQSIVTSHAAFAASRSHLGLYGPFPRPQPRPPGMRTRVF